MRNLILTGDWHLRKLRPRYRRDESYLDTLVHKCSFIVDVCNENDADLLIAGDIFDSATVGYSVFNPVLEILGDLDGTALTVPGQHDMVNHNSDLAETPYMGLILAGAVQDVSQSYGELHTNEEFNVWGMGYNETVPSPTKSDGILLAHTCVTKGQPPWFFTDAISAEDALDKYSEFRIIVTGDYHIPHITKKGGRILVNVGTIVRNSKGQIDYEPHVTLLNPKTLKTKRIPIPITASEDIFHLDAIEYDDNAGVQLDIEGMKQLLDKGVNKDIDFESLLWGMAKEDIDNGVINKDLLKDILMEAKNGTEG